jgi:hypothetical protein
LEHNSNYIGFKPFRITHQSSFTTLITDRIHVIFSQTNVILHVPANGEATDDIFIHGNFIIITTYYIEHIPHTQKNRVLERLRVTLSFLGMQLKYIIGILTITPPFSTRNIHHLQFD